MRIYIRGVVSLILEHSYLHDRQLFSTCVSFSYKMLSFFQTHLPGYVEKLDEIKSKGVDVVACIAVNDVFVMDAWGKDQKADGKVRLYCYCRY